MIKFRIPAFIAVMVVATLLAMGKLTTSAQANSAYIMLTPTGTPITDPIREDEPVSGKEQEELKAVIQAYFDMRYKSLSISEPYGFRPDSHLEREGCFYSEGSRRSRKDVRSTP